MFRRAVVLLIDGLRPDAVTIDRMPSLYEMGATFVRVPHAVTVRPSTTVAALTSLITGVSPTIHGVTGARVPIPGRLAGLHLLPKILRRNGLAVSAVAGKLPLVHRSLARALASLAGVQGLRFVDPLAEVCFATFERAASGLAFVYFPHCDQAGHADGWMSHAYLDAAGQVDKTIGLLASQLEDDLLIVLSDHGGGGVSARDHDARHPLNERISLTLAGQSLPRSLVIERRVSLLDVPATIAEALGVAVPSSYQGRSLMDLLAPQTAVAA